MRGKDTEMSTGCATDVSDAALPRLENSADVMQRMASALLEQSAFDVDDDAGAKNVRVPEEPTRSKRRVPKVLRQYVRFAIVGLIAFAVDYGLFLSMTYSLGIDYLVSSTVSFSASTVVNYLLSMRYVYDGKQDASAKRQFAIFAVLSVIALGLNQFLLWLFVSPCGIEEWISKLAATFLVSMYNFGSRKLFLEDHDFADTKEKVLERIGK